MNWQEKLKDRLHKKDGADGEEVALEKKKRTWNLPADKKKWGKRIAALAVVIVLIVAASKACGGKKSGGAAAEYTTLTVEKGSITQTLTGSGTLEPADSYTITTLVEGDVLDAPFEEGDIVEKDQLLYTIDSSDAATNMEKSQLSLESAERSYQRALESQEKLQVSAKKAGTVVTVDVEVGDDVQAGQTVATVRNADLMTLKLAFNATDAQSFFVGDSAAVTIDGSLETLSGTVSKIYGVDEILTGNMPVRYVEIEVENPGGITPNHSATAMVGSVACAVGGSFTYQSDYSVTAEVPGTVASISVTEGSKVSKNQTIVVLESSSVEDSVTNAYISLRNAELSLDNQNDILDSYNVTSPISGTIIDKTYKMGDTVESGKTLCTVYDLSYLTMTLAIDELDISTMKVGQTVQITADAVTGKVYEGKVTKVSVSGTTSGGVTAYPVTIQIDETEGLLPGMNVDATIVLDSAEDILVVPVSAVARGNRVLVKSSSAKQADGAPNGYGYVEVEVGLSNENYVEIVSGLSEGDEIAYLPVTGSTTNDQMMMSGVMMSGPSGGGMPSGGGIPSGGGMPGGGRE